MQVILCCCPLQLAVCGPCCMCVTSVASVYVSKLGTSLLHTIRTLLVFWLVAMPLSSLVAGHTLVIILTTDMNDKTDIEQRKHSLCGQINDVLCYFGKRQSIVKLQLMKIYCTGFYGSVLWDLDHAASNAFCATWRKCLRRLWGVPYCTHSSLLPVMSSYLP